GRLRSPAASSPPRLPPKSGWLRRGPRRRDRARGSGGPSLWICRRSRDWIGVRAPPKSLALLVLGEGKCEYAGEADARKSRTSRGFGRKSGRSTVDSTDHTATAVRDKAGVMAENLLWVNKMYYTDHHPKK